MRALPPRIVGAPSARRLHPGYRGVIADSRERDDCMSSYESTWAVHFPGNLRWTNAMQIVKGMAPYGAIAMDEVDRVGRRLKARAEEPDLDRVWREEWAAMADRVAAVADAAAAEGRDITAGHNYMRAGNYYYSAERFILPGPDK